MKPGTIPLALSIIAGLLTIAICAYAVTTVEDDTWRIAMALCSAVGGGVTAAAALILREGS